MSIPAITSRNPLPVSPFGKLYQAMQRCSQCDLRAGCQQVVCGDGYIDAEVLFIGEAPGRWEDEKGIPFIGQAGGVFSGILRYFKLSRESIYVTNVVKCRPPNNRDPVPDEMQACRWWLAAEIEMVDPKLIVCLGAVAARTFLPDKAGLPSFRALPNGRIVVSAYHPAFFLRGKHPAIRDSIIAAIEEGMKVCGLT